MVCFPREQEYEKALKYVRGLLQTEPQNNQAKELERLIDKAMKKGEPFPSTFLHSPLPLLPGPLMPLYLSLSVKSSSFPQAWAL